MRRRSWRLFFEFLAHTGLRIGEAIALTWDDVDFGHRRIHVRRRFYRGRYDSPKSKYGRRTIPLSQGLSQALWRLSGARPDDALVFVSATGKTMDSSNLMSRVLKPAAKTAGVPWVGFHTFPTHLRHDALSSRTEREAGADVARASLASVHARNVHLLPDDLPDPGFLDSLTSAGSPRRDLGPSAAATTNGVRLSGL